MARVKEDITERMKNSYKSLVRVKTLGWIVSACVVALVCRAFYLQLIRGSYYDKLAQDNCVRVIKIPAARGYIYDRNYTPLVINKPSYTLSLVPYYFDTNPDKQQAYNSIAGILGMDPAEISQKMEESKQPSEFNLTPVVIKRDLSEKELSLITEKKITIAGLFVTQEPKRWYENNSTASHVLGYTGEITADQMKIGRYAGLRRAGDIVGQGGIENVYDDILRGEDGAMYILTDAKGRQKEVINTIEPKTGKNLVLTIDYRLQKFAEKLMDRYNYNGVVLASDPRTGEILCMVSKPDYNLNNFSGNIDVKEWKKLIRNKANPLTNRAVQGLYSPGSIFKIAVGCGALNENVITSDDSFLCEGIYWIKTWPYKCWKRSGHGWVNFEHGVAQSCDIYFYKVGLKMKVELLNKYALMFGMGEKTGIDLPGEKAGIVPSREWKRKNDRTPWFPGNTVMMSIGQGYISGTPLQILDIVSSMANSGYVMTPHLMKVVTNDARRILRTYENKELLRLDVKPEVIDKMKDAMRIVVQSGRGTGGKSRVEGLGIAGKTGTVQNPQGENHAMFGAYAPLNNPEIALYILVEHGGGGGDVAAPLAGEIFEFYFKTMREK
ncbi:MAG: penicillin-binding protein 2 [Spirochaetia bacterium]|nr:penicillin-binding protein 2 [Spirochaetia bacterium]